MLKEGVEAGWEVRVGVEQMGRAGPWMAMRVTSKSLNFLLRGLWGFGRISTARRHDQIHVLEDRCKWGMGKRSKDISWNCVAYNLGYSDDSEEKREDGWLSDIVGWMDNTAYDIFFNLKSFSNI